MDAARPRIPAADVSADTIAGFIQRHTISPFDRMDQRIRMAEEMIARMSDTQRVKYNIRIAKAAFLIASDIVEEG